MYYTTCVQEPEGAKIFWNWSYRQNLGPMKEHSALLTPELSLHPWNVNRYYCHNYELRADGRSPNARWAWWPMPVTIAFRKWRPEDQLAVTISYV